MKIIIAIPAFNEASVLSPTVDTVVNYCQRAIADEWRVVIADNGSTDGTSVIAQALSKKYQNVSAITVPTRGKGAAIRAAWNHVDADVYCFMDADLATDLSALPTAIAAVRTGADVVCGSRFHRQSVVQRSLPRWVASAGYRAVARLLVGKTVSDLPCGFKAITSKIKETVLSDVANDGWFFDSELVIRSVWHAKRVAEIPVRWRDPREGTDKSRVRPLALAREYLRNLLALRRSR